MEDIQERSVMVMGRTGCGKSTFIKAMILNGDLSKASLKTASKRKTKMPEVSSGVTSCTKKVDVFSIPGIYGRVSYNLIDCMGLQDTDKEDATSVEQMAKVLSCLTSLVGIVYIIDGRMTPAEAENCNYVFKELLADVKPADVLVLRTKQEDWDEFNADEEKKYLKGGIPETLRDATWIAVDFDKHNKPEEGRQQVELIKQELSKWTKSLQLSDKTKIACKYVPDYIQLSYVNDQLKDKEKELEVKERDLLKLQHAAENQAAKDAEYQSQIEVLQEAVDKLRLEASKKTMVEKLLLRLFSIFGFSPDKKRVGN